MSELVSIITPCYNGEAYIRRFMDSILQQDYSYIELIIVDDGSTDKTASIIKSYKKKYDARGYILRYYYQDNAGQSAALNLGLKLFQGSYFTWPDSDDFLLPNSISLRVDFLEKNKNFSFVRSDAAFLSEDDLSTPIKFATSHITDKYRENLFDDLIFEKDAYVCNGCYLVRTSSFLKINPSRNIYESRAGQNWQLLVPLAYHYSCGYIDKPLYHVVERINSHSRSVNNMKNEIIRCDEHFDILENAVEDLIEGQDLIRFKLELKEKYLRKKLEISLKYESFSSAIYYFKLLKNSKSDYIIKLLLVRFGMLRIFSKLKTWLKARFK